MDSNAETKSTVINSPRLENSIPPENRQQQQISLADELKKTAADSGIEISEKLADIVDYVDPIIEPGKPARLPGNRAVGCGLGSDLVRRDAQVRGFVANNYETYKVARLIGLSEKMDFRHGFSIVNTDGADFLVDLTYCQFIDYLGSKRGQIHVGSDYPNKSVNDPNLKTVVALLIDRGYFPLTDQNLRSYIYATTTAPISIVNSKLDKIHTDIFSSIEPSDWDRDVREIDAELNRINR